MVVENTVGTRLLRRAYDVWSHCYDWVAPLEHGPRLEALSLAQVQPDERVLDLGCATGGILTRLRAATGPSGMAVGLDLSRKMLQRAQGARLQADVRQLPLRDASFDVVFSAYVIDLLPLRDIPTAMDEIYRILRPGGRVVLLNMTKRDPSRWMFMEQVYRRLPRFLVAYLLGACRPVYLLDFARQAGFAQVDRRIVMGPMPSEVVLATRPASH